MAEVYLQLFGDFVLTDAGQPVTTINTPRLRALLAYLALHRHAPQPRKHLAFLFWPDSTESQALTNLRKHLHFLNNELPAADQLLVLTRQTVQWSPTLALAVDVAEFDALLACANTSANDEVLELLRQAVDLYRGDLLPECYEEWIFAKREALREYYANALNRVVLLLEAQRDYPAAILYAQRLLHHDPFHEVTYRTLMRLHALNGDRAAALRIYHTCLTQLSEELGVDPDSETEQVYARLLQGNAVIGRHSELVTRVPFVGRQHEWQVLQQRWRVALRGQPQFVLIAGEAGIGKTRLAEELLSWAMHQGFATVRARCYAAEGRLTYAPVIEWLRAAVLRSHRNKLAATWLSELARLLPEILSEQPSVPRPEPMTQNWQRHHLFEAVARALLAIDQPLLLLMDDLQWCDKETLELLHFLLRNATTLSHPKLLLLGTARLPDEVEATHPLYELLNPLRGSGSLIQLDLVRLNETETSELARQMAKYEMPPHALQQLFRDTAGNPLFVVETMRVAQGPLTINGFAGPANVDASQPLAASAASIHHLPLKVLAVIQARLSQLSPTARELCDWAAIVGRAFTLDLLASASQIAVDKAVTALDELWQRRILREQGSDAYDFSHDRIRDVATAGISGVRRKYLHRRVAEALERQSTDQIDRVAVRLAAHFEAAGVIEKAVDYYERAAKFAPHIYVNYEAVPYLQRALALLKTTPESADRHQRELSLVTALGPSLVSVSSFASALMNDVYKQAVELAHQLKTTLHPSFLRIFAVHRVGWHDYDQAYTIGQQLLSMAGQQTSNVEKLAYFEGCYVLGITEFYCGHFLQARDYLRRVFEGSAISQTQEYLIKSGQETAIIGRVRLSWTLWYLGYPDQARAQRNLAWQEAEQLRHQLTRTVVFGYATACACSCRDVEYAEKLFHQFYDGDTDLVGKVQKNHFYEGWISVLRGDVDRGMSLLLEFTSEERGKIPNGTFLPYWIAILCAASLQSGCFQPGLNAIDDAFSLLNDNQDYFHLAEMYRIKGELLYGQGQKMKDAETCFLNALEISRRQAAKSLELRAAMSLARLWDQQSKRDEARTLLAEVYNWFTEGFDTADLQEAKLFLQELTN